MDIDILFFDFDEDKTYYVNYEGKVRACKPLYTHCDETTETKDGRRFSAVRALVAMEDGKHKEVDFQVNFFHFGNFDSSYQKSYVTMEFAESVEDLLAYRFIRLREGSTSNCYNGGIIRPLLPNYSACGCGGGIYFWAWIDNDARKYGFCPKGRKISYKFDKNGFYSPELFEIENVDGFQCGSSLGSHPFNSKGLTMKDIYPDELSCRAENEQKVEVVSF